MNDRTTTATSVRQGIACRIGKSAKRRITGSYRQSKCVQTGFIRRRSDTLGIALGNSIVGAIENGRNELKWDELKQRADQLGLGASGVDAARATGQLTPEQVAAKLDAWERQQGRDAVERQVLADLEARSGDYIGDDYDVIPTAGGSGGARMSGGRSGGTPIQPVLNGNWDAALNLASDPFGLLDPLLGMSAAINELKAADAEAQLERTRKSLIDMGVKEVPTGYEMAWGESGNMVRDFGATADKLARAYEGYVRDQRLTSTWGADYANVRIGKSNMTVQEFESKVFSLQQKAVDQYYDIGRDLIASGQIEVKDGNYARTLGTYMDGQVRDVMREFGRAEGINTGAASQLMAVNRRITNDMVATFGIPDVRLGYNLYSDTSLSPKDGYTEQLRRWNAIRTAMPGIVVMRPTQMPSGGAYVISPYTILPPSTPLSPKSPRKM